MAKRVRLPKAIAPYPPAKRISKKPKLWIPSPEVSREETSSVLHAAPIAIMKLYAVDAVLFHSYAQCNTKQLARQYLSAIKSVRKALTALGEDVTVGGFPGLQRLFPANVHNLNRFYKTQ